MQTVLMKSLAITFLILGEMISVYSEMIAAKGFSGQGNLFLPTFTKNTPGIMFAGALLIAGYMLGYSAFKNIWMVSVVSVTSILIVEPGLTYFIFRELPGRGALLGLIFGACGFLATLLG